MSEYWYDFDEEEISTRGMFFYDYEDAYFPVIVELREDISQQQATELLSVLPEEYTDIEWDGSERFAEYEVENNDGNIHYYKAKAEEDGWGVLSDMSVDTNAPGSAGNMLYFTYGEKPYVMMTLLCAYSGTCGDPNEDAEQGQYMLAAIADTLCDIAGLS